MGFFDGAAVYWRGILLALRESRLRRLVLAPSLLAAIVAFASASAFYRWLNHRLHAWLHVDDNIAGFFLSALVLILAAFGLYLFFLLAAGVLNAPFAGPLSERTEELQTGQRPPQQSLAATITEIARGIFQTLLLVSVFVLTLVPLLFLAWLLPIVAPFLIVQTALFIAYDALDAPLSRDPQMPRTFSAKWAFVRAHLGACLGFGLVGALLLAIPIVNFFVPPLTAIGGTLLYRALVKTS